jgi:hypothetical protein
VVLDLESTSWAAWTTLRSEGNVRSHPDNEPRESSLGRASDPTANCVRISQASVAKYMVRNPKPPAQTWRTFLRNHVSQLASVDFFTVYTVWFEILFVFIVLAHDRRVVHFNVTAHPTAE